MNAIMAVEHMKHRSIVLAMYVVVATYRRAAALYAAAASRRATCTPRSRAAHTCKAMATGQQEPKKQKTEDAAAPGTAAQVRAAAIWHPPGPCSRVPAQQHLGSTPQTTMLSYCRGWALPRAAGTQSWAACGLGRGCPCK